MISLLKALLIVLGLLGATQITRAQNHIFVGQIDSFGRSKDLTKFVETQCVNQLREQVGAKVLEVRYDRASTELAQKIVSRMKESIARTFEILDHSDPVTVRIYLAKVDKLPAAYQIVNNSSATFVWPIIYDDKTDLNLDCESITKLCETIYTMIPHELTHHVIKGRFGVNATWLEEGLCEFVSGLVGSKLSPRQAWKQEMVTLPEVSLNSEEIRKRLIRWNYSPETMTEESVLFYGASHQMMRLIIAEAEKQGEKDPIKKIMAAAQTHDGSFTSEEVLTLLNKELKVDVTKLGVLDPKRKNEIFEAAKSTYLLERYNPKTGYRYTALNTFAYLGEPLPDEFLVALIQEVFDEKGDRLFRRLSAKALLLRLDQFSFDRTRQAPALSRTKLKKYDSLASFQKFLSGLARIQH